MTIGYEGRDATEFVSVLSGNNVKVLYDVRYRAGSRRKGFSKTALNEACQAVGIRYHHDRELGTPPDMMQRVRELGAYSSEINEEFRELLLSQKETPLQTLVDTAKESVTCLLCYEADPTDCHRTVVAEEISKRTDGEIVHL